MPYLMLDDGFPDHRKVDALGHGAFRLHVSGLCYSARELTDGHVPSHRVPRLMRNYKSAYLTELQEALLWLPDHDGYAIHDYLEWNKSRDWWQTKRKKDAARLAAWRMQHSTKPGTKPGT